MNRMDSRNMIASRQRQQGATAIALLVLLVGMLAMLCSDQAVIGSSQSCDPERRCGPEEVSSGHCAGANTSVCRVQAAPAALHHSHRAPHTRRAL